METTSHNVDDGIDDQQMLMGNKPIKLTSDELLEKLYESFRRIAFLENQNNFLRLKFKLTLKHCLDNVSCLYE